MTHRGSPSPSSHSLGPRGNAVSPSPETAPVPSRLMELPFRPRSRHEIMTSSIAVMQLTSRDCRMSRSMRIHSCSWRSQTWGCDQSSRTTISVFGMVSGVRSGLMREVKAGDGVERRYSDMRARVSAQG